MRSTKLFLLIPYFAGINYYDSQLEVTSSVCKVAPMAKFKCAPFHNYLNISYKSNFYES